MLLAKSIHMCLYIAETPQIYRELFLFFLFSFGGLPAAGTGGNVGALLFAKSSLQGLLPYQ